MRVLLYTRVALHNSYIGMSMWFSSAFVQAFPLSVRGALFKFAAVRDLKTFYAGH